MARTMSNELNPPTKRRHDYPSAFPYSGHAADCNCSCYLKDTRSSQQRYCTGHESSFNPVGSYTAPDTLRNSGNDWRTSRTRLAESHPNPSSVQSFKPIGDILDLPPVQFSDNWSDSPNLGICDREGVHEPVSSDSPWMPQTLWDSGRLMKTFLEPKERNDSEHLVKDIRSSNSNEPSEFLPFLPTCLPSLRNWDGEDFNLSNDSWFPLGESWNFASGFDNSRFQEFEATNLSMTHQSTTNPNTPSSGTLPQQTVSSDPSYDTPNILEHNLTFTDTHIGYGHVQTPTKVNWGHFFPSSDITPPPAANSYREKTKTQHPRKTGKRQGALKPEIAKRAAQIRRQRACWLCWLSKVPCSTETTCHRCSTLQSSPLFTGRVCNRTRLSDYTNLFFPEQLIAHLRVSAVQKAVDDNVAKFSKKSVEIKVASGQDYPTITVNVRVFQAHKQEFLAACQLNAEVSTSSLPTGVAATSHALPLGLPNEDVIFLKRKCSEHIKCMVSEESDWILGNVEVDGGFDLPWRAFNSIRSYRRKSTHKNEADIMLRKATMLYAMHDFIGRVITIADGTGYGAFEHPDTAKELTYDFELTSKILNRQLKHAMHLLLQETTRDVLDGLERELKTRTKESWAPCFCTILILCICIEELQIAIDGFAVYKATRRSSKANCFTRANGFETSRQLDNLLYNDCKTLFHAIYNSHKPKSGLPNEKGGFNPIRDTYDVNGKDGVTQAMHDLVGEIHEILGDSGSDGVDRAKAPSVDTEDESLEAHMAFRERNSGRLVSDFLRSFLDGTS